MLFPNFVCIDNFFDNPDEVITLSKKLKYTNQTTSPGVRSKELHDLDYDFFNWVNLKICSVFYPNDVSNIRFNAKTHFQKTKKLEHDNWVHKDETFKFTAIIYLNKENTAGTSIFSAKKFKGTSYNESNIRYNYFKNEDKKISDEKIKIVKDAKSENNKRYNKTFSVEGIYNRLVIFDGNTSHASNPMKEDHERLTLISFIDDVYIEDKTIRYPVPTMRSI